MSTFASCKQTQFITISFHRQKNSKKTKTSMKLFTFLKAFESMLPTPDQGGWYTPQLTDKEVRSVFHRMTVSLPIVCKQFRRFNFTFLLA